MDDHAIYRIRQCAPGMRGITEISVRKVACVKRDCD